MFLKVTLILIRSFLSKTFWLVYYTAFFFNSFKTFSDLIIIKKPIKSYIFKEIQISLWNSQDF